MTNVTELRDRRLRVFKDFEEHRDTLRVSLDADDVLADALDALEQAEIRISMLEASVAPHGPVRRRNDQNLSGVSGPSGRGRDRPRAPRPHLYLVPDPPCSVSEFAAGLLRDSAPKETA